MVNKRGAETVSWPQIIWIVVFMIIFVSSYLFINKAVSGAVIYEEIYAKKIALILDGARSGSDFSIDVSDALEVAKKNKFSCENRTGLKNNDCFFIEGNSVRVVLDGTQKGYGYVFFSDYKINLVLREPDGILIIGVVDG